MDQNIILLFGGTSNERLVSCASAQFMVQAINNCLIWFWAKDNRVYEISKEELLSHKNPFIEEFKANNKSLFSSIEDAIKSPFKDNILFLLALHGGSGENGYLQGLLEKCNKYFTGSNSHASRLAFDKMATKEKLLEHGLRLANGQALTNSLQEEIRDFYEKYGESIVKPICGGSSLGIKFIKTSDDIDKVIDFIKNTNESYMIEQIIKGREITIGVMEDKNGLKALPATEILLDRDRQFDYEGKYLSKGAKELTPADLNEENAPRCNELALKAHNALGLSGYSRTDMILSEDGPVFLEINTLPGLSKTSLIPQQLACAQITMEQFLLSQIELAKTK